MSSWSSIVYRLCLQCKNKQGIVHYLTWFDRDWFYKDFNRLSNNGNKNTYYAMPFPIIAMPTGEALKWKHCAYDYARINCYACGPESFQEQKRKELNKTQRQKVYTINHKYYSSSFHIPAIQKGTFL